MGPPVARLACTSLARFRHRYLDPAGEEDRAADEAWFVVLRNQTEIGGMA